MLVDFRWSAPADTVLRWCIRSGRFSSDALVQIACTPEFVATPLRPRAAARAVRKAVAQQLAEEARWPARTDCDRLDAAFETLWRERIIALHAVNTLAAGVDEARARNVPIGSYKGCCFYDFRDLIGAVWGCGLRLAYASLHGRMTDRIIGDRIIRVLDEAGLRASLDDRGAWIRIFPLAWQRRFEVKWRRRVRRSRA